MLGNDESIILVTPFRFIYTVFPVDTLGESKATNAPRDRMPNPTSGTNVLHACVPVVIVHGTYHSNVLVFSRTEIDIAVHESGGVHPCIVKLNDVQVMCTSLIKP